MKCVMASSKAAQKKEWGFYDSYSNKNVVFVHWNDNRAVCMASNFTGIQPLNAVSALINVKKKELMFLSPTAS